MSLEMFEAYLEGVSDRVFEYQLIGVQVGYWSAYFNSKRPKPLSTILNDMVRRRKKQETKQATSKADSVDVEAFLAREREFNRRKEVLGCQTTKR